jgi:hypothetical protein
MKRFTLIAIVVIPILALVGCVSSQARRGQALFAGCLGEVDEVATQESGLFVCQGRRDPEPFGGNGRACGDCHVPGDNFGISPARIASLPDDHPLFYDRLDENWEALRTYGLVHVVVPGELDSFRRPPTLVGLQRACDDYGECGSLGLLGDRVRSLCIFSLEEVRNHLSKTLARLPDQDFRELNREECEALTAYMISDLVADQDERNR